MHLANYFPLLLDVLLKSVVVLTAALLIDSRWRGASAASRHFVWAVAFAVLLFLPFTRLLTPRWAWNPTPAGETITAATPKTVAPTSTVPLRPQPAAEAWHLPAWDFLLLAVWLTGAIGLVGFRAVGSRRLWWLKRRSEPLADERVLAVACRIAAADARSRRVVFRQSAECPVPLMWGVWRPVVVVPVAALDWSEERLRAVLRHELAHVRRQDYLTRAAAQWLCVVYWVNPLAWLAVRALRLAQEQACDDLVLRAGTQAEAYATLLCEIVRSLQSGRVAGQFAVAMAQPSTLERRVCAIVDDSRDRRPVNRWMWAVAAALVAGVLAGAAVAQVQPAAGKKTQVMIKTSIIEVPAGKFKGVQPGEDAATTLQKLVALTGADVLSAPQITTLSGHKATIMVGQEVMVNAADGKQERVLQGVVLELLPDVAKGNNIQVSVDLTVRERLPGAKKPLTADSFCTRHIKTDITVRPGEPVLLGPTSACEEGRDLVLALTASLVDVTTEREQAAKIIIPQLAFQDVTVAAAVTELVEQARALDPKKRGVNIVVQGQPNTAGGDPARITLTLRNISLLEALKYVAALANLELQFEPTAILLAPKAK